MLLDPQQVGKQIQTQTLAASVSLIWNTSIKCNFTWPQSVLCALRFDLLWVLHLKTVISITCDGYKMKIKQPEILLSNKMIMIIYNYQNSRNTMKDAITWCSWDDQSYIWMRCTWSAYLFYTSRCLYSPYFLYLCIIYLWNKFRIERNI